MKRFGCFLFVLILAAPAWPAAKKITVQIPADAAPDAATQKAILDKASDYVAKTYGQLPDLTATKTTIRFQDSMDVVQSSSGMHSSASEVDTNFGLGNSPQFFRLINVANSAIESNNGVENPAPY